MRFIQLWSQLSLSGDFTRPWFIYLRELCCRVISSILSTKHGAASLHNVELRATTCEISTFCCFCIRAWWVYPVKHQKPNRVNNRNHSINGCLQHLQAEYRTLHIKTEHHLMFMFSQLLLYILMCSCPFKVKATRIKAHYIATFVYRNFVNFKL